MIELDRKRNASLKQVSELSPRERADAVARMEENTLIVQWVQQCLERRISSYRWALERLVIQAPDNMAADADRLIGELAAQTANPPVAAQPVIGRALSVRALPDPPLVIFFFCSFFSAFFPFRHLKPAYQTCLPKFQEKR